MTVDITDPTVASETQLKDIERFHGASLHETPTELLQFVVDQSKTAGNQAFRDKRYQGEPITTGIDCNLLVVQAMWLNL